MQYFVSKTTPLTILIMFDRDDLLLEGIQAVVKKEQIDTAAITGGTLVSGRKAFMEEILHQIRGSDDQSPLYSPDRPRPNLHSSLKVV